MATNNIKETTDLPDGNSKENLANTKLSQDSTIQVNGTTNAKTGGQMNGGVVAQSGNRIQKENQKGSEPS